VGSIAAGLAAFATGFISYMWLTLDSGPADAGSRAGASDLFVSGSIHPKPGNLGTASVDADMQGNSRLQLANLETGGDSATAFREPDHQPKPSTRSSFGERFAFDLASAPSGFLRPSQAAESFDDRFIGEVFAPSTAVRSAAAARSVVAQASVAQAAPKRSTEARFRLASASDTSLPLAYAPTDSVKGSTMGSSLKGPTPSATTSAAATSREKTCWSRARLWFETLRAP